jgi:hypothetical protein
MNRKSPVADATRFVAGRNVDGARPATIAVRTVGGFRAAVPITSMPPFEESPVSAHASSLPSFREDWFHAALSFLRGRARRPAPQRLAPHAPLRLGEHGGELIVVKGVAWLTCRGDARDYFVAPGERVLLADGHGAVVESADAREAVVVRWSPLPRVRLRVAVLRVA